jgi:hypothetical protein
MMLRDQRGRADLAASAREHVLQEFELRACVDRFWALYEETRG